MRLPVRRDSVGVCAPGSRRAAAPSASVAPARLPASAAEAASPRAATTAPTTAEQGDEREPAPPAPASGRRGALQLRSSSGARSGSRGSSWNGSVIVAKVANAADAPDPTAGYLRAPRRAPREAPRRGHATSPSSFARSASARPRPDGRPLRDPLREQVVAVDLEPDPSPLRDVAVEPLGAERPGERQLDPGSPAGELDRLGRTARAAARGELARLPDPAAQRRRKHRVRAGDDLAPRLAGDELARPRRPAPRRPAPAPAGPTPPAARTPRRASGSAASFRSSASTAVAARPSTRSASPADARRSRGSSANP